MFFTQNVEPYSPIKWSALWIYTGMWACHVEIYGWLTVRYAANKQKGFLLAAFYKKYPT